MTSGVSFESSLNFDQEPRQYGTRHGVLTDDDPAVAVSSPLMRAEALDVMLGRVASSGVELSRLAAIAGSAQQHGSVYLNARAAPILSSLDSNRALLDQIREALSRGVSPIWMDSSTATECPEIEAAVGGRAARAAHWLARVRALHGPADPQVLQARSGRLRGDRSGPL